MRLELEAAHEQPLSWSEELSLDDETLRLAGIRILGVVVCQGEVYHSPPDYIVRGELRYRQQLQCFRCMEAFDEEAVGEFDFIAQLRRHVEAGDEIELDKADLDVLTLAEPLLETESLIVEQIHLLLAMKPLCAEGCKGLCASCGSNLNTGSCDCLDEPGDSRFAGLADLKAKLEKEDA